MRGILGKSKRIFLRGGYRRNSSMFEIRTRYLIATIFIGLTYILSLNIVVFNKFTY